ncbi:MAG: hypothetical protein RLZZ129_2293 [Verrucomicrobiota bacterium]|jgi:hypothetical protein
MSSKRRSIKKAVAHYLFVLSKDVEHEKALLYRATALTLINEPIAPEIFQALATSHFDQDPLYMRADIRVGPDLEDVWDDQA